MSFICEDIGTTKRRKMTQSRALRIWEAHGGKCVLCGLKIDGAREDWFIEHIRALELGGSDDDDNCGPAHYWHKAEKDAADHSAAAAAKRAKQRHIGIRMSDTPMPFGRRSREKKRMNGDVVDRYTGEIIRKARP